LAESRAKNQAIQDDLNALERNYILANALIIYINTYKS